MTAMSVRDRDREPNTTSTKEQLINAAVRIFHQKGFQKTRISDIVSAADVAQGTFYLYFKSKEEIFRHIIITHTNRFVKAFEETELLFGGKDSKDIWQNINRFLNKLLEIYKLDIKISELLFREGSGHGGLFKESQETFCKSFIKLLQEHMKRDIPSDKFHFGESETMAMFLLGVFLNSASYFMPMKKQYDTEKLAHKMTDFMLNGLQLNNLSTANI